MQLRVIGDDIDVIAFRLRNASNSIVAQGLHSPAGGEELFEGTLDLSSETNSEYYVEIHAGLTSALSGESVVFHAAQLERIPAAATGPGDWHFSAETLKLRGIEDGADVTANNTASGFLGQGNLATGNMYYQPNAPSNPKNGDFWAKPDDKLYFRDQGVWDEIASLSDPPLSVALSGDLVFEETDGAAPSVLTSAVTASASGGDGTYAFEWAIVGRSYNGSATDVFLALENSVSSTTQRIRLSNCPSYFSIYFTVVVKVTDGKGAQTFAITEGYAKSEPQGGG